MTAPSPPARDAAPSADPSDQRYRQLFESSPLPLWVYDLETLYFLDVNEVACRKYGWSRDEFLAMTILEIRPPEDRAAVQASVAQTPTSTFSSGIWRHRRRDGTLVLVEITSHEMTFMGRRCRCVCPIDVTQRVEAEARLCDREAALRRAESIAGLAHVITDPDGRFDSWSDTLPGLIGRAPDAVPRTTREWIQQLVHPDDRELLRARSVEAMQGGERIAVQYRLLRPDGAVVHIAQFIEPAEARAGDMRRRWFSTLQDVTARQQAADRIQQLNEELEDRVRRRTAELESANAHLAAAMAEAERANRAKSDFLSNMSHELRTPLNAILGFGQLLGQAHRIAREPAVLARYGDNIVDAGQHLMTLINEILDLASIEAGKLAMRMEEFALADALAECQAMIAPLAVQRSVHLEFAPTALRVRADRTRLKQVLLNLLSNAIKYGPTGATVTAHAAALDGARVRIAVEDRGQGMRPEQLAALFQPFNRLGQEAGATQGTGLGLVVTKRIVEAMGGDIGVSSAEGVGSTFWIDVDAAAAAPLGV